MQNKILSQITRTVSRFLLIIGSIAALAACGNPQQSDLISIAGALKDAGFHPNLEAEYRQRISQAKNEEDVRGVLRDQLALTEKAAPKLKALKLKSDEGRSIQNKLAGGFEKMGNGLRTAINADFNNQSTMLSAQNDMRAGGQDILAGMQEFATVAKTHGLNLDETLFQDKIQGLKESLK